MNVDVLDKLKHVFHVDAGRRQQMVSQRFTVQLGGQRVTAAHFEDFTHQGVAVGVRAAGGERDQHIAIGHFAAVDNF